MPTLRRVEIALRFLCHTSLRRARLGLREFAATVQSSASPFQDGNQDGLRGGQRAFKSSLELIIIHSSRP